MESQIDITFTKHHSHFVVGVLDIVDSTKITAVLDGDAIDHFYTIFLSEITKAVRSQDGWVIKNIGDGILFYFPKTDYGTETTFQKIIDSAKIILNAREKINQELSAQHLPTISYRMSLSFGPVSAMLGKNEEIIDIFGSTVSTCAKFNKLAAPNTIVVGQTLFEHLDGEKVAHKNIGTYAVSKEFTFPVYQID